MGATALLHADLKKCHLAVTSDSVLIGQWQHLLNDSAVSECYV